MQNFVRKLLTEWRKLELPFDDEIVVAAVSGGADSVSLLLALQELRKRKKLNLRVVVAHYNHNLRGDESEADEQFVKNLASRFDFELALGRAEDLNGPGNLEQNARDARYAFLAETAENLDAHSILTAHTLNDQAETFLFNLLRGSGLDGLGGMKPIRSLKLKSPNRELDETENLTGQSQIQLVRPLLSWAKRKDTEDFCFLNKIEFRYDAMNEDLKFNRVRIRKVLLPLLEDFNPKIIETLARTAELLREDAENLSVVRRPSSIKKTKAENDEHRANTEELPLKDLQDVFPSIRRTILREWLKTNRGNLRGLRLNHIEAIERLAASRKSGRRAELPGGEIVIKKNGKLCYQKTKVEK